MSWTSGMLFIPGVGLEASLATTLTYAGTVAIKRSFLAIAGCAFVEWRFGNDWDIDIF